MVKRMLLKNMACGWMEKSTIHVFLLQVIEEIQGYKLVLKRNLQNSESLRLIMFNTYMYLSCLSVEFPEICIFAHRNNACIMHTCNHAALTTTLNVIVVFKLMFINMDLTKECDTIF